MNEEAEGSDDNDDGHPTESDNDSSCSDHSDSDHHDGEEGDDSDSDIAISAMGGSDAAASPSDNDAP
jgi:hypothetical protein